MAVLQGISLRTNYGLKISGGVLLGNVNHGIAAEKVVDYTAHNVTKTNLINREKLHTR